MKKEQIQVTFQPDGKKVTVAQGSMLSQAAIKAGIPLEFVCGGQGTCGKCRVRIVSDAPPPTFAEQFILSKDELARGFRLACQTRVPHPMEVEVASSSRSEETAKILVQGGLAEGLSAGIEPIVVKQYIELEPPTLQDGQSDLERLRGALGAFSVEVDLLRLIPHRLRATGFRGTAVLADGRLVEFEEGDTQSCCFGVAFDIGTTTLVATLLDLADGCELAATSRLNPQARFGDDVVSRIFYARERREGLRELHETVIDALNLMIVELAGEARIPTDWIYEAVLSGNTTMLHLAAAISPAALGEIPFVPVMQKSFMVPARELGLNIHPRASVVILPVIGGFVGGDTVAGVLVTGLAETQGPVAFLDIGTNGEVVVVHDGKVLAASCAAGPAFEGARIAHGMRATAGAIEEVSFQEDVHIRVIGGTRPAGLCGSALIDLAAELLRHSVLTPEGLLLAGQDLPGGLAPPLRDRVVAGEEGAEFVVAKAEETATGRPVTVTQRDLRNIQLATGAIRAGIRVVLNQVGLKPADLERFYVAGAFGNYIRPHNAQRMGLLPHDLDRSRIVFVGNTSLAGARLMALSRRALRRADELASRAMHVELSCDPAFQTEYVEALFFPREESQILSL